MRTRLCLLLVAVVMMATVLMPQTEGTKKSWLYKWLRNRASAKKKVIKINTGGSKLKPSTVSKTVSPTQNNIKRRSAETMQMVPPPPPSVLAPEFLQQWYTMCLNHDSQQTSGAVVPQRATPSMKALLRALQLSAGTNNADMLCSLLAAEESRTGSNDQYAPAGNVVA